MVTKEEINIEIEKLREYMESLIIKTDKLVDPEILLVSEKLDQMLNIYNEIQIKEIER